MSYGCNHGEDLCDQCLDLIAEGEKCGREELLTEIIATLEDADHVYDFHSNCRLCEAITILKDGSW